MILIDYRDGSGRGKTDLSPYIKSLGIPCEKTELPYADACFEGNGPNGPITIGVERKTLNDMLNCIDDSRYSAYQKIGMEKLYTISFLCIEGLWEPGNNSKQGVLMQGFKKGLTWGPLRLTGGRTVNYSKLYRYLLSISLSSVIITYSTDLLHTAYNIAEIYQYFSKPWTQHRALLEVQKVAIPDLNSRPSLVRKWANDLEDIGNKYSMEAARLFKTPKALAEATEQDWCRIKGIGSKTARKIVRQIRGE